MFTSSRALCLALLLVTLLGVAACASRPKPAADNARSPNFTIPPKGSLITLLPPLGSDEIEKGMALVYQQVTSQLRAAGYRVATLDRDNYNSAWTREVTAVGGIFDQQTGAAKPQAYAAAMTHFAQYVYPMTASAILIQPGLVSRTAKLHGSTAEWDGHVQAIPVTDDSFSGSSYSFSGTAPALSVELQAIMADGTLGFRTYGGTALPYRANLRATSNEPRSDLFSDDREVAAGVQIALEPLLVK